jgi:Xaa-Pro aminopeptidase
LSSSSSAISESALQFQNHLPRFEHLVRQLARFEARTFLIAGSSASEPDLAAFLGPAHIGRCFIVGGEGIEPHLGYFTEMEREEASATGLALLDPATLGLAELQRDVSSRGELAAAVWLRALELVSASPGPLVMAGRLPTDELIDALPELERHGWPAVGGNAVVLGARKEKSAWEVGQIRLSARGTCEAFRCVARMLSEAELVGDELHYQGEPLTGGRLRRGVSLVLAGHGLDQPAGNILAAGYDSAIPHSQGSMDHVLRPGESLVVDLYPKGHLFADCSRTFCLPPVPEAVSRAHTEVILALRKAEANARAGVTGRSVQDAVCDSFEEAGFDTPRSKPGLTSGYVHSVGHGVGFELHELPNFRSSDEDGLLAAGDVVTLEPGLYSPAEQWGIRVENLYLVGETLENLTPLPESLDPREWAGLE